MTPKTVHTPFSQNKTTRREALALALSAGLSALIGVPSTARAQNTSDEAAFASLGALLDTFLPEDDLSPAATAVGVATDLRAFLSANGQLEQLFIIALNWMDGLAQVPFWQLSFAERTEILTYMSAADYNQIPGRFYHIARALAVEFYYATPESLAGLGLNPSPQPEGYLPPWR
ncbi:gluconate 2-dehydrogenase subunit 3-like protein [Rhodobacter aestuarii]|uniref:Gluconate 2-dehydrogenase subunit 3 n=1 Tax=Rhodobacter aestuarii TaxID=453582 RepID=A0A1N7IY82_9RHOB|nr:gluconate 2-dehydrogenase subunit 3 family protein [Rhodobacter aestuarii]PTV97395.1 gluconate 2-dehydrogenase subunit 3-like protein [Rhodobacter aestuarii]SIS42068.1 Gluconate 2-dehydrogenase subunit 3 [Rhodobacter aestuarii]